MPHLLVLKTFNKELVMQDGNKIERVFNERDVLKRISGTPDVNLFKAPLPYKYDVNFLPNLAK